MDTCYYGLADMEIYCNKMQVYHKYYWPDHVFTDGVEHVATFNCVTGGCTTSHVKRLFKLIDPEKWVKAEALSYRTDKWAEMGLHKNLSLLKLEPYSRIEEFFEEGEGASAEPDSLYFFADVECKSSKLKEYHEYWRQNGPRHHAENGAEHVATFTVISGAESTAHVQRLFKISDFSKWIAGEANDMLRSDRCSELADNVKISVMHPTYYSHLR